MPSSMHILSICPVLMDLLLPQACFSCLSVTLKAPWCTKHLKIHIICSKLKLTSSSGTQPDKSVYQHWKKSWPYCLLWERCVCLQHGTYLGGFKQGILIMWNFHLNSIMWWDSPVSQKDLRGWPSTENGRRMNCLPWHSSVTFLVFGPKAQSWHWETEEMTSSPSDQPHFLSVLWVLRTCQLLSSPLQM